MNYEPAELLPVVANLTDKFTSKESSSVTYETARILMEAVIYCINECTEYNAQENALVKDKPDARTAYKRGYEIVMEKANSAKEIYERLIKNFEDYGCQNYSDTIQKGMPKFFVKYDPQYNPQDHILTLDYPALSIDPALSGVDLILEYLKNIEIEKRFLDLFDRQAIVNLLQRIHPQYKTMYLDNICYSVLLHAMGCMIADKPLSSLELYEKECSDIALYFEGDSMERIELKIKNMIDLITQNMADTQVKLHLTTVTAAYAARIKNAIQNSSLEGVFI